jgi:hypothetical protein
MNVLVSAAKVSRQNAFSRQDEKRREKSFTCQGSAVWQGIFARILKP